MFPSLDVKQLSLSPICNPYGYTATQNTGQHRSDYAVTNRGSGKIKTPVRKGYKKRSSLRSSNAADYPFFSTIMYK
ncbi:hypothetical protein SP90_07310 [Halodesulfovibrio spirochaetisodalis]|uniref:Uncharacterized protein n=1 Tax=Halodesulfovibrio spirochaetisodalis TaxID=1560234 RepID=A0A1B7XDZ5_9BACT|nr:hypothetical protein SP90_07310 [Halodesulfovibrio spirochaetisodalis]